MSVAALARVDTLLAWRRGVVGAAAAVSVAPVRPVEVLGARIGVLAVIGIIGAIVVAAGSGLAVAWVTFVPAVVLTALLYTAFGYAVAMRARSVNEYFARATAWSIPLFAPLVVFMVDPDWWGLALWPTTASLVLLHGEGEPGTGALALVVLVVGVFVVGRWALAELEAARREGRP